MKTMAIILALSSLFLVYCFAEYVSPIPQEYINSHSDNFGVMGADYPVAGVWHCGDDIPCPIGTTVLAPVNCTIIGGSPNGWDFNSSEHNNFAIKLSFRNSSHEYEEIVLGHLKRPLNDGFPMSDPMVRNFRAGEEVVAGEILGQIGEWGDCSHLHIGVVCSKSLPISGLGRQPLPRPNMQTKNGIIHYNEWYDPLPWLQVVRNGNCDDYSVRYDNGEKQIYFVEQDIDSNEIIYSSNLAQNAKTPICQIAKPMKLFDYLVIDKIVLVIYTDENRNCCLGRMESGQWFEMGKIRNSNVMLAWGKTDDTGLFFPLFEDESNPTMVYSSADWSYKPIKDLLYKNHGKFSFFFSSPIWRMLGARIDPKTGDSKIFVVTGDENSEYRGWVKTGFQCSNLVLIGRNNEVIGCDQSESVAFLRRHLDDWIPSMGTLTPINGDALHKGYDLTKHHDLIFSDKVVFDCYNPDSGRIFLTIGEVGSRKIASCDKFGNDLQIIR